MMYNSDLKLEIGQDAENIKKGLFGQIWVCVMLPFCDFEIPVMLPFSKILGHVPPLIVHSDHNKVC